MPRVKQPPSIAASQPIESPPFAPPPFNLWVEPWITVEDFDGRTEQHSIESALLNAHTFKSIYDPSPLVVVGIQRLLIAILQDAINPRNEVELRALIDARRFPTQSIADFRDRYAHRFDLFSAEDPFLQSRDLPLWPAKREKLTAISKLFLEIPSGKSAVTLYMRTTDADQVFSPATVAAGLMTLAPFASSQGKGYFPSINGVPPIYVLPRGTSLFENLATALLIPLFWPSSASHRRDDVWWRRTALVEQSKVLDEVGYLHSLTFPTRRLRLHPERVETICTRSGKYTEWGVRTMIFEVGETRSKAAPSWQDPFAAYLLPIEKKRSRKAEPSKKKKADQPTPIRPQSGRAIWREFGGLFTHQNVADKAKARPLIIQQIAELDLVADRASYSFQCVGVLTDKAKTFEWVEFGFDVPPAVLNDPSAAVLVDNALAFANDCGGIIASVFAQHFGGSSRKAERHLTLKTRMVDSFWSALAGEFRHFVLLLGDREAQRGAFEEWTDTVVNTARAVFARAAESIGDDAANLRLRSEGEQHCAASLYTRMKKEFNHE